MLDILQLVDFTYFAVKSGMHWSVQKIYTFPTGVMDCLYAIPERLLNLCFISD